MKNVIIPSDDNLIQSGMLKVSWEDFDLEDETFDEVSEENRDFANELHWKRKKKEMEKEKERKSKMNSAEEFLEEIERREKKEKRQYFSFKMNEDQLEMAKDLAERINAAIAQDEWPPVETKRRDDGVALNASRRWTEVGNGISFICSTLHYSQIGHITINAPMEYAGAALTLEGGQLHRVMKGGVGILMRPKGEDCEGYMEFEFYKNSRPLPRPTFVPAVKKKQ